MPFRTLNSSFIFDLRRRSITEWAVFLAIFFPAALVELGCFFPAAFIAAAEPDPFFALPFKTGRMVGRLSEPSVGFALGFICMIFRERVGGGGKEKSALVVVD